MLCSLVLVGCREYGTGSPSGFERVKGRVEQHSTNAVLPMAWIAHDVVHDTRRSSQRHVVVPLDARVGVTNHLAGSLRDEDDDVWFIELTSEIRPVSVFGLGRCRQEAKWIEVVVRADEERAELPDGADIFRRGGADVDGCAQRSTIAICFSL